MFILPLVMEYEDCSEEDIKRLKRYRDEFDLIPEIEFKDKESKKFFKSILTKDSQNKKIKTNVLKQKVGYMLKCMGLPKKGKCYIGYDNDFYCKFDGAEETYHINSILENGDNGDSLISIYNKNYKVLYSYNDLKEGKNKVKFCKCIYRNTKPNNNTLYEIKTNYDSSFNSFAVILRKQFERKLVINFNNITKEQLDLITKNISEVTLNNIINELEFPISIIDIYNKIKNKSEQISLLNNIEIYNYSLKHKEEKLITKDGNVCSVKINRGEKIVCFDELGWVYQNNNILIKEDNSGNIDYKISIPSNKKVDETISLEATYDKAINEVEDTKQFVKTLTKKL